MVIPQPLMELTTRRVMTMEWITGVKLTTLEVGAYFGRRSAWALQGLKYFWGKGLKCLLGALHLLPTLHILLTLHLLPS